MKKLAIFMFSVFIITCQISKDLLPEAINGLVRNKKLQGTEAEQYVNRLHMQNVVANKSEIGFYETSENTAIIYITHYNQADTATNELNRMIKKIQTEKTPFVQGENISINEINVFRCFGLGQTHYVFSRDNILFWVSADTLMAEEFIEEYLERI